MSQPLLQCSVLAMFGEGAVVKQGGGAQVLTLSWTAASWKPGGALRGPGWNDRGSGCNLHHSGILRQVESVEIHQLVAHSQT